MFFSRCSRASQYLRPFRSQSFGTMQAIQVSKFGDASALELKEIDIPTPGPNQYLVKVEACGVNPVDTYIRSGVYPKLPTLPYTPGKDAAGVVAAAGADCKGLKVGDRVYAFGAATGSYAQYTLVNDTNLFPLPECVSFAQGACLGTPGFTAYRALFHRGAAVAGDTVLVHGASGGVGLFAVQMAAAAGMTVVGTASTPQGRDAIRNAGAAAVFNHREDNYIEQIRTAYPNGFNVCLEMLASTNLGIDLTLMAMGGRVAIIGSRGTVEINPRDMMSKELDVKGVMLLASTAEDLAQAARYMNAGLENGHLLPVVSLELPLKEAPAAHKEIIDRSHFNVGNIVLLP